MAAPKALPLWPARASRLALLTVVPLLLTPALFSSLLDAGDVEFYKRWIVNAALVVSALVTGLRALCVRSERLAWTLLAAALGCYATGQVYWAFWLEHRPEPPFPSVCDGLWLAIYPLGCGALVLLARRRLSNRPAILLDGVAGGAALAALAESAVFGAIVDGTSGLPPLARTIAIAYPIGDLVLFAAVVAVFALTGWALAAWAPPRRHVQRSIGWRVLLVPTAGGATALTTLVYGNLERINALATGLAATAIVAGILRAFFTFGDLRSLAESQREAVTDHLTGLGNRRLLMRDLEKALAAGRTLWLVLLDLDGFKAYNDRFGHTEGDLLLARLGWRLAGAMEGRGGAYRIGGDEFCVLIPEPGNAPAVLRDVSAALQESGEEFSVVSSSGVVHVPSEASDASSALRIADARMYAQKNSRPGAAKHQAGGVALAILAEAQPTLGRHVDDVSLLAVALGRELGLGVAELDDLAQAADLHDVGKVAIPSSILDKPGPLEEEEWHWMRRHTLIGERMLAGAPALRNVARIVRATHERFDGTGYPDALAGEEIPLAARVIAVCDAFDAMVSDRVYRPALSYEQAIRELERGAGTQFDPRVVSAFLAVRHTRLAVA